jgi:hypothetical protein
MQLKCLKSRDDILHYIVCVFCKESSSFDADRRRSTQVVFEKVQSIDVNLSLKYIKSRHVISIIDLQILIECMRYKKYMKSRDVISRTIIIMAFDLPQIPALRCI